MKSMKSIIDKVVTKEDINYMKRTLDNYTYHRERYKTFKRESEEYQARVDEEFKIRGVSYGNDTHSSTVRVNTYQNELILTQASLEKKAKDEQEAYVLIEKRDKLRYRLNRIPNDKQCCLYAIYFRSMSYKEYAELENITTQAISERINSAIRAMLEVEV